MNRSPRMSRWSAWLHFLPSDTVDSRTHQRQPVVPRNARLIGLVFPLFPTFCDTGVMADSGAHQRPDSEEPVNQTGPAGDPDTAPTASPAQKPTKGRAPKLTPMMQRYTEVKGQNPEAVLLFRMGDFTSCSSRTGKGGGPGLGLTLTSRDKNFPQPGSDGRVSLPRVGRLPAEVIPSGIPGGRSAIRWRTPRRPRGWCGGR
ncbi:MAG: hypothetical protein CM1200mP2_11330 [Planctomycetaceae bacterium]|nr:MAG: hypothetical protein CM1200mP2_11330 [Planctomycetaceae bacterium]